MYHVILDACQSGHKGDDSPPLSLVPKVRAEEAGRGGNVREDAAQEKKVPVSLSVIQLHSLSRPLFQTTGKP